MIPQVKKILYATDLSKNSAYAFYYAIDLAHRRDAKIVILHVIESLRPMGRRFHRTKQEELQFETEKSADLELIKKRLEDICQKVDKQIGTSCVQLVSNILVREGLPLEEILKAGEEEQCDLFILGTHGKGFLKQTFLGSVSRMVLDRSRKPVLIIPLPSEETKIDWDEVS